MSEARWATQPGQAIPTANPPPPPLKVLAVNLYYAPDTASSGQILAELCEGLVERALEVTVVVGQPSYNEAAPAAPPAEELNGVRVRCVSLGSVSSIVVGHDHAPSPGIYPRDLTTADLFLISDPTYVPFLLTVDTRRGVPMRNRDARNSLSQRATGKSCPIGKDAGRENLVFQFHPAPSFRRGGWQSGRLPSL